MGSAAIAQPGGQDGVALPNAADPKPAAAASQGKLQMAVISLERPAKGAAAGTQGQRANEPANSKGGEPMPFHKPKDK